MALNKRQLAVLHIARQTLNLDEPTYRRALVQIAGVASARDLDEDGFRAMMGWFDYLGFAPNRPLGPDFGPRAGMASHAQLEMIRALRDEYTGFQGRPEGLNTWILRTFKVSSLRFLTKDAAQKAITALLKMKARGRAA